MAKYYNIKNVMVEGGYVTVEDFCSQMLDLIEDKGMLPPYLYQDDETDYFEWEPEND